MGTTRKESEEFYDDYVDRQLKMGINHRHISIADLLLENGMQQDDCVLEVGCGVGTVTKLISKIIKRGKIVANDISSKSLDAARKNLSNIANVSFVSGDIIKADIDQKFDWIILPDVIEHIPLEVHAGLFMFLDDHLKEDGKIFIHIPNPFYLSWVRENRPEQLQIIDQPIHLEEMLLNLKSTSLIISKMVDYSIYVRPSDYRYLVLVKKYKEEFQSTNLKSHNLLDKVKLKLKYR